ncbi:MAG: glycosyltransferase family 2 protein [Saprospiraceae bacterium]|nr:glycosyltransferase family 2 protein [Saprospiraceae bacterium]
MTVAGFTFIRNALIYDYPIVEAIRSLLPVCDFIVVAVGKSEDATLELIQNIGSSKIRIVETTWDDTLREGGRVLALETDKAFDAIGETEADWCFYIQGDEVLPDIDVKMLKNALEKWKNDSDTEGVLFKYRHFYGSYDFVGQSRKWYRREVRIIKNDKSIRSYRDAQGFRKNGRKLKVREIDAYIYHYGWVKDPRAQQLKQLNFNKLWHTDAVVSRMVADVETFDYSQIDDLTHFDAPHPEVMQPRIQTLNWQFSFDPTGRRLSAKERLSRLLEHWTGWRFGEYKNFKKIGNI